MSKSFLGYQDGFLPFGPAAGAISGLNEEEIKAKVLDVANSPAAFAKMGSVTYLRNIGNSGRTYGYNSIIGKGANAIGLSNIGHVAAVGLYRQLSPQVEAQGKELIPSFSPGKGDDPNQVLPTMAYRFVEAGAKTIEANYSCPNKEREGGGSFEPVLGYDLEAMFEADEKIVEAVGPDITIIRKLPPPLREKGVLIPDMAHGFTEIEERAASKGRVVLAFFNTDPGQALDDENGQPMLSVGEAGVNLGGASGPAYAGPSVEALREFKKILPETVGIISGLGVNGAAEVYRRVDVEGADWAEGVLVFTENEKIGKSYGQTIAEIASDYQEIHERINELS